MAKQKFERNKEHANVGTIGHVDHGKTTLSAAFTAVSSKLGHSEAVAFDAIDNAPEEKERGITIKASTIEFDTEKRHYSLTDCPGHADYVKNMITGASQADALILVIAATDGKMQQTTEHIMLAKQIGCPNLVIFVNKTDAVEDADLLELVIVEAQELAEENGFKDVPVLTGSALGALNGIAEQEENIKKLMECLDGLTLPPRKTDKPFLLPVEGVHVIPGRGTVVTGKIEQGIVKVGDQMEVLSEKRGAFKTTVTGVEMFRKELDEGRAGDNVGLLLRGVPKSDLGRGDIIAVPGSVSLHNKFKAEVYITKPEEGGRKNAFKPKYRPQFFMRIADVTGTVEEIYAQEGGSLEKKEIAMPGDNVTLNVELIHKVGIEKGLRFSIREGGRTIGAGIITEIIE
jgi:elongation factor Tu